MKKLKTTKPLDLSPEDALVYIDSMQKMLMSIDEPTQAISLRVPANILRGIKLKAKARGLKYQSLIVQALRHELNRD